MTGPEQHAATVRAPATADWFLVEYKLDPAAFPKWARGVFLDLVNLRSDVGAAEARADELQRERDRLQGVLLEVEHPFDASEYRHMFERSAHFESEAEQARREADQLRAALREIGASEHVGPHALTRAGTIARAALAGVQAEKGCQCPAGSYDRGNAVHAPYCPQADNKDSAAERPPRDSGKPRSHP